MARSADPGLAARRRRQIIDAALSCFRRRGFHQATMQEICIEAALSPGAVYRYFPSKTDIIAAIAEDDHRHGDGALTLSSTGEDLIETMCFLARGFVDLAVPSGDAPLVADVISEALRNREFGVRLARASAPLEQRLTEAVEAGQKAGAFERALDSRSAARIILGALDGLCLRASVRGDDGAMVAADVRVALERLLQPRAAPKTARRGAAKEVFI